LLKFTQLFNNKYSKAWYDMTFDIIDSTYAVTTTFNKCTIQYHKQKALNWYDEYYAPSLYINDTKGANATNGTAKLFREGWFDEAEFDFLATSDTKMNETQKDAYENKLE